METLRKPRNKKTAEEIITTTDKTPTETITKQKEPVDYRFIAAGLAVMGVLAFSQYKPTPQPKPEPTIFRKMS